MKAISIVVPVYNVEKYIKRCIDSLLEQNFDNYEIIVVNDGTKDNSMDYVRKVQRETDKIIIYEQENAGLSAARNSGIRLATGKYILFCDSDDALEINCLSQIYKEMEDQNLDVLLYDAALFNVDGNESSDNPYERFNVIENTVTGEDILRELIKNKKFIAQACLYTIRRRVLIDNCLEFEEGILHEDELFTPILLVNSERVCHRNWKFYKRYLREGSIMLSDNWEKRMKSIIVVITQLLDYRKVKIVKEESVELLGELAKEHSKNFLAQSYFLKQRNIDLKVEREEIYSILKKYNIKLEIKFKFYLIYLWFKNLAFEKKEF